MSIDVHSLMSSINMEKLLMNKKLQESTNIQPGDLVRFIEQSEPCLFGNSTANLMPVKHENMSLEQLKLLLERNDHPAI